jgi:tRNA 2-thiouridine synthesizing protein A
MDVEPDSSLDCTGMICPMPIVKIRRALKPLEVGQVLEMIATDPGVVPDMEAWERQTRHEILLTEEPSAGTFRFLIKKTH